MNTQANWSTVFHRSRMCHFTWFVRKDMQGEVWAALEYAQVPQNVRVSLYDNRYEQAALLDGLVLRLTNVYWPTMPSGTRVVGPRVLRWLSHELNLKQPSLLLEESGAIPTFAELNSELHHQLQHERDVLERRCELGIGVCDRHTLQKVIGKLFGEGAASPTTWDRSL